ncbi:hypothetical protein BUALT_Bualt18G0040300 [Buddleja alternifolia]|uniref:Trichome birefringence-like C-terminal domain-containing protein n=1 Tax=Buddleja alternifolia TaxID=168488 RepID=A0AAV6W4G3_9LAMI|nr:hypothetical protein BUALT_Bualt18G0040300 [Buddleja alternifolia]
MLVEGSSKWGGGRRLVVLGGRPGSIVVGFVGEELWRFWWQLQWIASHSLYSWKDEIEHCENKLNFFNGLFWQEYDLSVMFLKNGFLVSLINRTLKLDTLTRSDLWNEVDILIFNSYHWWLHTGRLRTWDNYQIGNKTLTLKDMDVMEAYKTALTTWANWVDSNVDPTKTRVFFQGISTVHYNGTEWNEASTQNCSGQTKPVEGSNYPGNRPQGDAVVKNVLSNMKKPAILLDIVLLTQLRKDGHPSTYAGGPLDCSHWCLAGVPDTWNQLFYTILLQN